MPALGSQLKRAHYPKILEQTGLGFCDADRYRFPLCLLRINSEPVDSFHAYKEQLIILIRKESNATLSVAQSYAQGWGTARSYRPGQRDRISFLDARCAELLIGCRSNYLSSKSLIASPIFALFGAFAKGRRASDVCVRGSATKWDYTRIAKVYIKAVHQDSMRDMLSAAPTWSTTPWCGSTLTTYSSRCICIPAAKAIRLETSFKRYVGYGLLICCLNLTLCHLTRNAVGNHRAVSGGSKEDSLSMLQSPERKVSSDAIDKLKQAASTFPKTPSIIRHIPLDDPELNEVLHTIQTMLCTQPVKLCPLGWDLCTLPTHKWPKYVFLCRNWHIQYRTGIRSVEEGWRCAAILMMPLLIWLDFALKLAFLYEAVRLRIYDFCFLADISHNANLCVWWSMLKFSYAESSRSLSPSRAKGQQG